MHDERRRRRSEDLTTALRYQLEASAARADLALLVLTDDEGNVLAQAGIDGEIDVEAFGLALPSVVGRPDDFPVLPRETQLTVKAFPASGRAYVLGALGEGDVAAEVLVAMRGARRILS